MFDTGDHTTRGCTTVIDLDTALHEGADWLVVSTTERDTLYVTHHGMADPVAHVFTDPGERQGLRRALRAILARPDRLAMALAAD